MPNKEKVIRIYMSHCIRGRKGNDATQEDIDHNCRTALAAGEKLKTYFLDWYRMDGFPKVDLYVPAENDEFVQLAYNCGMLTIDQILDVDCQIVDKCDMMIVFGTCVSSGMEVEITYATENVIPIFAFRVLTPAVLNDLKHVLKMISY